MMRRVVDYQGKPAIRHDGAFWPLQQNGNTHPALDRIKVGDELEIRPIRKRSSFVTEMIACFVPFGRSMVLMAVAKPADKDQTRLHWPGSDMIGDADARKIASVWHGGQTSSLYLFVSTGAVDYGAAGEVWQAIPAATASQRESLELLLSYLWQNQGRGPVEDWHKQTVWL